MCSKMQSEEPDASCLPSLKVSDISPSALDAVELRGPDQIYPEAPLPSDVLIRPEAAGERLTLGFFP